MGHSAAYGGPPALTWSGVVTAWELQPAVLVGLAVAAGLYLWGVRVLRRRGVAWSRGRSIAFLLGGVGTVGYALMGWMGVYDDTLFWAHMAQHMVLSMVAPIFLALGAPVTLALRAMPRRPRGWLRSFLHSLPARLLLNPLVGFALVFGVPFVLYMTGLYEQSLRHDGLHAALHVHFLVAGCVFFWPIVGVDPVPGRFAHPFRLLLLFVTLPAHAWLGISIMTSKTVIAGSYYAALHRPWGPSLSEDQSIGGGLLWAAGDLVGLLVVAALFFQWARADDREAVRIDRRIDRDERTAREDAVLATYNAHLAALARHDAGG